MGLGLFLVFAEMGNQNFRVYFEGEPLWLFNLRINSLKKKKVLENKFDQGSGVFAVILAALETGLMPGQHKKPD